MKWNSRERNWKRSIKCNKLPEYKIMERENQKLKMKQREKRKQKEKQTRLFADWSKIAKNRRREKRKTLEVVTKGTIVQNLQCCRIISVGNRVNWAQRCTRQPVSEKVAINTNFFRLEWTLFGLTFTFSAANWCPIYF